MLVKIYTSDKKSAKGGPASRADAQTIEVSSDIFKITKNTRFLSQVVRVQQANKRRSIADTKTRGEVSGGGRKPFRQKGTGNARAGSIRSPLWIGGGVTFGPRKTRNFTKRINRKMAQKALKMVLSDKAAQNQLIIVPKIEFSKIATRDIQAFLEQLPIEEGKILMVLAKTDPKVELSAANLPYLKTILASGLNLLDLLNYDYLVTDKEGLRSIEKLLTREGNERIN